MRSAKGLDAMGGVTSARDAASFEWTCPKCSQTFTGSDSDSLEDRAWDHLERVHHDNSVLVRIKRVAASDAKLRSGISVTTCPICNRAVVAKSGVIQPHADMKKGGWCKGAARGEDVAEAKDSGILDHPLAALAALLGILIAFRRGPSQGERNQEANYDLRQYRPKPKEW